MFRALMFCFLLLSSALPSFAQAEEQPASQNATWHYVDADGQLKIKLYFFWSKTCPHCAEAHPFIDSLPEKDDRLARIPMGRYGRADEVSSLISYLASDAAAYLTGQNIRIDGGLTRSV